MNGTGRKVSPKAKDSRAADTAGGWLTSNPTPLGYGTISVPFVRPMLRWVCYDAETRHITVFVVC